MQVEIVNKLLKRLDGYDKKNINKILKIDEKLLERVNNFNDELFPWCIKFILNNYEDLSYIRDVIGILERNTKYLNYARQMLINDNLTKKRLINVGLVYLNHSINADNAGFVYDLFCSQKLVSLPILIIGAEYISKADSVGKASQMFRTLLSSYSGHIMNPSKSTELKEAIELIKSGKRDFNVIFAHSILENKCAAEFGNTIPGVKLVCESQHDYNAEFVYKVICDETAEKAGIAIEGAKIINESKNKINAQEAYEALIDTSIVEKNIEIITAQKINKSRDSFNALYCRRFAKKVSNIENGYINKGLNLINASPNNFNAEYVYEFLTTKEVQAYKIPIDKADYINMCKNKTKACCVYQILSNMNFWEIGIAKMLAAVVADAECKEEAINFLKKIDLFTDFICSEINKMIIEYCEQEFVFVEEREQNKAILLEEYNKLLKLVFGIEMTLTEPAKKEKNSYANELMAYCKAQNSDDIKLRSLTSRWTRIRRKSKKM